MLGSRETTYDILGTGCLGYGLSWVRVVLGTSCLEFDSACHDMFDK